MQHIYISNQHYQGVCTTSARMTLISSTLPHFGTEWPFFTAFRQNGDSYSLRFASSFALRTNDLVLQTRSPLVKRWCWIYSSEMLSQSPSEASTITRSLVQAGLNWLQQPLKTSDTGCSYSESLSLLTRLFFPPKTWQGTLNSRCCSSAMKWRPVGLKMPNTESPMWQLRSSPVKGCRVMIVSVAEPFSSFLCTACRASSAGLSIQYSSFSLSSDSLTAAINLLEYAPESMPSLLQPPTPSATIMIFFDTNSASYPPFQTLFGCGAQPQPTLNSQRFSPKWLLIRKIFFLSLLFIIFKSKLQNHLAG